MKKLTAEQKKLVADNHNIIYGFLNHYNFDVEEYYGICAIELCNAAMEYDETLGRFSTIAYFKMYNSICNILRKGDAKLRKNLLHYDNFNNENNSRNTDYSKLTFEGILAVNDNFEKNSIFRLQILRCLHKMNYREKMITLRLLDGKKIVEIAEELGITHQYVSRIIKNSLRKKLSFINEK